MKFKSPVVWGLAAILTTASLSPVTVEASMLLDVIHQDTDIRTSDTDTSIFHDTDITDSSLIDKSLSHIKTGDTSDGSNSSATGNSNNGDGVNTNVSSTDVISTDVKDNLDDNHLFNDNYHANDKSKTHDESKHYDNSKETDRSISYDNSRSLVINNGKSIGLGDSYGSTLSAISSLSAGDRNVSGKSSVKNSNSSTSSKAGKNANATEDGYYIDDEDVALAAGGNGWCLVHEKEATCTDSGYRVYYNPQTHEQFADPVDAFGHEVMITTQDGGFLQADKNISYCTRCGKILSEEKQSSDALPFAGLFGGVGAFIAALIKRH